MYKLISLVVFRLCFWNNTIMAALKDPFSFNLFCDINGMCFTDFHDLLPVYTIQSNNTDVCC